MGDGQFPEDIVAQGSERGPRFPVPGWRPSRAAGILALVTLLAGLAVGYAIGHQQGGRAVATARSAAPTATAAPASQEADQDLGAMALTENAGTCSMQVGHDLELGIPVTNMSAVTVLLRSASAIDVMPSLLKVVSWSWAPCGFDGDGIIPDTVILGPGETTWLTATVNPLVACPGPAPLQFNITYSVNRQNYSFALPGFSDLSSVSYSGCQGQPSGAGL